MPRTTSVARWGLAAAVFAVFAVLTDVGFAAGADQAFDRGPASAEVAPPPAAPPALGGIGGTGIDASGGIGGTGVTAGGIGGTGIVGTVTGFGSIVVNGLHVEYDAMTPVTVDGDGAGTSVLSVGQIVEIDAVETGAHLTARSITVRHAVSGPIEAIAPDGTWVLVMGQTVEPDRSLDGAVKRLLPGQSVRVSGHRRDDGVIVASRIDRNTDVMAAMRLSGPVSASAVGRFAIGGTDLLPESPEAKAVLTKAVGRDARMQGRYDGRAFRVQTADILPEVPFQGTKDRLILEGYVTPPGRGEGYRLGPWRIAPAGSGAWRPGDMVRVALRRADGDAYRVERATVLRPAPEIDPGRQSAPAPAEPAAPDPAIMPGIAPETAPSNVETQRRRVQEELERVERMRRLEEQQRIGRDVRRQRIDRAVPRGPIGPPPILEPRPAPRVAPPPARAPVRRGAPRSGPTR